MRVDDLDYELPPELIAQEPLAERDASRLMLVDVASDAIAHAQFQELPSLLPPSLFVFNDTRVFGARLHGEKQTGGRIELLLLRRTGSEDNAERWLAMGRSSKPFRPDSELSLAGGALRARVVRVLEGGQLELALRADRALDELLAEVGEVPLPPYIRRAPTQADEDRYQTVYAKRAGAVAAPTAGLHFTKPLLKRLAAAGHESCFVTLHVGPGTFRPIQAQTLDEHPMHEEHYEIEPTAAIAIERAQAQGRPVVAVGTTVVRTLESAVDEAGRIQTGPRSTRLFIRPPYSFQLVDHMVTNFHLPRSTLLALVMAFAGTELIRRAYEQATHERYRFYSYGDAMLIRGRAK